MLCKIQHLLDLSKIRSSIVFINHEVALEIVKQISLTIAFTNKLNLHLVRALNYIQRFDLELRYKSSKQYVVSNALSRLTSTNNATSRLANEDELNALFTIALVKIKEFFRKRLIDDYKSNLN